MTATNKIEEFLKYLSLRGVSQKSLKYYKSDIVNFLHFSKDRKIDRSLITEYIETEKLTTPLSTLNRRLSTLRSYSSFMGHNYMEGVENVSSYKKIIKSWQDRILSKFETKPKIKNALFKLFFTRPNWYKRYHSYPLATYIHIAILILFTSVSGYALYDQVFYSADRSLAFPTALTRPNRFLSFQGRITSNVGNPITSATNVVFKLYDASSGGTNLWDSGTCSITPDQDGIFSTLLGSSCGAEIASSVFSENAAVWVGVTVGADAEATPRIQIATVAYALNSETLQGFPAGTGTSTIPYINSAGTLVLANASPKLQSTSGTFAVEGLAMTISTPNASDGVVTINPDGVGTLDLTFEGTAPGLSANGFVNATNANITSGSLYSGTVASAASGYNFINFLSGVSPTSKFSVDSTGQITSASGLTIGTTSLSETTSAVDSGAYLIGTFDEFDNSSSANVQDVLDDLDAAITTGGGSSIWSLASGVISPTTATNDLVIGGTTLASSIFSIDESAGTFLFGGDQSANPTLTFEATDSDTGDFGFNTNDSFYFSGANVGINTITPSAKLEIARDTTTLTTETLYALRIVDGTDDTGLLFGTSATDNIGIIQTIDPFNSWTTRNLALQPNGGNVGIGTTTPTALLDVAGTATVSGVLTVGNGTTNTIRSPYGPLNLNYKSTANTWGNGIAIQDITGNVGINLAATSTNATLHVNGTGFFQSDISVASQSGIPSTYNNTNVAPNPSFEVGSGTNFEGWGQTVSGGTITRISSDSHDGAYSMAQDVTVAGTGYADLGSSSYINVSPSTTYTLSTWAKVNTACGDGFYLRASWRDKWGNVISNGDAYTNSGSVTTSWALYKGNVTSPANAYKVNLQIFNFQPTNACTLYTDQVSFRQMLDGDLLLTNNLGIGDSSPVSPLTVGSGDLFQVDANGDMVKIKNLTYSWPSSHTASGVLQNDGSGNLTWVAGGVSADSLDYTEFQDTMDLDANLVTNQGAFTNTYNYTGTTSNGLTYNADSITSAYGVAISTDGLTSGSNLRLTSTSTTGDASGNTQLLSLARSGANANASHTAYGLSSSVLNTGTTSTNIAAYLDANGATSNYALITNRGNVGIGTTTPSELLTISKTRADASTFIKLQETGTDTNTDIGIEFWQRDAGAGALDKAGRIATERQATSAAYDMVFYGWSGSASTDYLRIESGGELGIGTSGPDAKLEINSATGDNLQLTYNDADGGATTNSQLTMDSSGDLTINNTGTKTVIADDLQISGGDILDGNGNENLRFGTTASAVDELTITNAASGGTVLVAATGGDTDIALSIDAKGSDALNLNGTGTGDILIGGGAGSTGCTVANATGTLSCTVGITASALKWNGLTAPDGNLTLNLGTNTTQFDYTGTSTGWTYNFNSVTNGSGQVINANGLQAGVGLQINSTSTAGTSSGSKYLILTSSSGINANASHSSVGIASQVTNTGTTSTNIAGYFSASGASNNYAAIFASGNVGIGNSTPTELLDVAGNIRSTTGTLQVGNSANTGYSRFGTATTAHAGNISTSADVLLEDLEVDGTLFLDGGIIANVAGTTAIALSATPTTTSNTLSSGNWTVDNTANVGQAALIINNTKAGDLFAASASAVTKASINASGDMNLGYSGVSTPTTTNPLMIYNHGTTNVASINTAGLLTLASDIAVNGGDLTTTAATFNVADAATTLNMGNTAVTRTINLGTGANADTINIGTGTGTANVISIGNGAIANTIAIGSSSATSVSITDNNWSISVAGLITTASDIAVNGGDLTTTSATFNMANAATTLNLGQTNVTRTINLGVGTNADTINIGTGGTTAENITIGSSVANIALTDANWSVTGAGLITTADDIAINGGDLTTSAATFNVANAATTLNLGQTNVTRTINLGVGTNADTINIGTGGTTADAINIGGLSTTTVAVNTGAWTFANDTNIALTGGVNGLSFDTSTLSIDATNNKVGVGDTSPTETLDITTATGTDGLGIDFEHGNYGINFKRGGVKIADIYKNTGGYLVFDSPANASTLAGFNFSGDTYITSGRVSQDTWTADGDTAVYKDNTTGQLGVVTSDRRLKKNIELLEGSLDIVNQLNTYKYNDLDEVDGSKLRLGIMSQEVMPLIPELTFAFNQPGSTETYYGVHYDKLGVLLLGAIKEVNNKVEALSERVIAAVGSFNKVETNLISPVANADLIIDLQPDDSQTASKLVIKGENNEEVASIDARGQIKSEELIVNNDATISGTLYADVIESDRLDEIESLLAEVEGNQALFASSQNWDANTATQSAEITDVIASNLFVTGNATINSLFVAENLTAKSLDSLTGPLNIQSLAIAPVEIMAGKIKIDTNGDTIFEGNVKIAGNLELDGNFVVAEGIDPTATNSATIIEGQTSSNSTAGKAVLVANTTELKIVNPKVKLDSLIYVTPVSSTENKVLYVKSKDTGEFVIGFNEPIATDVEFNWWIIELKPTAENE
jgi:hypothetical protein